MPPLRILDDEILDLNAILSSPPTTPTPLVRKDNFLTKQQQPEQEASSLVQHDRNEPNTTVNHQEDGAREDIGEDGSSPKLVKKQVRFSDGILSASATHQRKDSSSRATENDQSWIQDHEFQFYTTERMNLCKGFMSDRRCCDERDGCIARFVGSMGDAQKKLDESSTSFYEHCFEDPSWMKILQQTTRGLERFILPSTTLMMQEDSSSLIHDVLAEQKPLKSTFCTPDRIADLATQKSRRAKRWALLKGRWDEYEAKKVYGSG